MLGKHLWRFALAVALTSSAAAEEIVVTASAARPAIERILNADNVDVFRLSPREVADAIEQIPRGNAPLDFWLAYQEHVRAWRDYAAALDRSRSASPTDVDRRPDGGAIADALRRIGTSYDEVEEIARRYGAQLPATRPLSGS